MENDHVYIGFSHWKWWFSIVIVMLVYQRVLLSSGVSIGNHCPPLSTIVHCHHMMNISGGKPQSKWPGGVSRWTIFCIDGALGWPHPNLSRYGSKFTALTWWCFIMCWIGTKRTFIGGWPIKNCDFPWQTVSHNQMQNTQTASSMVPLSWTSLNILQRHHHATHSSCQVLTHTTPVWYRWDTNWSNATTGSSVGSLPARFQRPLVMTNSLRTWKWP